MWWKKTKVFTKQRLTEANLDPVPFIKERLRSDFARTVLEPLPIIQTDLGDAVEFQTDVILLSLPAWQQIKAELASLSESVSPAQRDTIRKIIESVETE